MITIDNYGAIIRHNVRKAIYKALGTVATTKQSVEHVALGNKTVAIRHGRYVFNDGGFYYMVDNGEFRNRFKTRLFSHHTDAAHYAENYLIRGTWRKNSTMVNS